MTIYINQYQSISINRLILIMDDQSIAKICVVIEWYWLVFRSSISIDWKCRGKWVIRIYPIARVLELFKYTSNGVYSLHWEDWVGIVSIAELFLCGYWLIIDWPIPTNTSRYQLTHFIDWLVFRSSISIDWKQREGILHLFFFSLLTLLILKLLFFADIINPWKYNTES